MIQYFKRVNNQKILQVWLLKKCDGYDKMVPFTCEREYFGEGIDLQNLQEIDRKEFLDIGWLFNHNLENIEEKIEELTC